MASGFNLQFTGIYRIFIFITNVQTLIYSYESKKCIPLDDPDNDHWICRL